MKFLICGLGSIGKRHVCILEKLGYEEISAIRTYKGQEKSELKLSEYNDWSQIEDINFDVAIISNPTSCHIATALECAKRGMHLFIEKPIDAKMNGLNELLEIIAKKKLTAYVAYPFRFHPLVQALKQKMGNLKILQARLCCSSYMPHWRSQQETKKNYSSSREMGGGVLLDLSHELDTATFLFGDITKIEGHFSRQSDITVDSEDCADLTLTHGDFVSQVHLDLFSYDTKRYIEIDTEEVSLRGDLVSGTLTETGEDKKAKISDYSCDRNLMFENQMKYFLNHIGRNPEENNLQSAKKLFETILKFRNDKVTVLN